MMKKRPLIFILILSLLSSDILSQKERLYQKKDIQKAELLIETGKPAQASLILNKIIADDSTSNYYLKARTLSARILHENGKKIEAIGQLQDLLASSDLHRPQNIALRTDAYLVLAECYFSMFREEKFKQISDTILQLSLQNHLPNHYLASAYLNMFRYYNYQVLEDKAEPYYILYLKLYNGASSNDKKYYNPILFLGAYINFHRNWEPIKLYQIVDSSIGVLNHNYQSEKYNQIFFWRAVGNAYFDRARSPNIKQNRKWYSPSINAFDKAISILKNFYLENKFDLVYLQNLHAFHDYCCGYYKLAKNNFISSEQILTRGNFSTYLWQDASLGEYFFVTNSGQYSVLVTNSCGSATSKILIKETQCDPVFPNAFTPNGDGLNDIFRVLNAHNLQDYTLSIYNRWGQKIFETNNSSKGWDGTFNGKLQNPDVYVWYSIFLRFGKKVFLKGTVVLIR